MKRLFPLASVLFLTLGAHALPSPSAAPAAADGKLVILGFDGADGDTVREMMEAGELPNLKRLAEQGTFAPLTTTAPAESPASWASLNTGRNPGKTAVPSFVRRETSPMIRPDMGHIKLRQTKTLDELYSTPIPVLDRPVFAGICGGAVFLAFLIVLSFLLRIKGAVAVVLSLLLGAAGGWGGWTLRGYLPGEYETISNRLQAEPFWETAAENGVPSVVLAAAQSFGRAPVDGAKVLAGLGVPDALGGVQNFSFYTTDDLFFQRPPEGKGTGSGGTKYRVDERDGVIESILVGPKNLWEIDQLKARSAELEEALSDPNLGYKDSLALQDEKKIVDDREKLLGKPEGRLTQPLKVELQGESAVVTLGQESQTLAEGQWSEWYHLTFDFNPLVKVKAITRAKILTMSDPFTLYVDAMQIDPAAPPYWQPISMPDGFAADLAAQNGPYETIGWACATMPFKDEELDAISFMEEIEFTFRTREAMTLSALERDDWRIFMSTLSTPDRVQHMMYQFFDPENPMHDPEAAAQEMTFFGETIKLSEAIPAIYRQVDRIVGLVLEKHVGPNDVLMLCADHGFQSFHNQVHINNWLVEEGFMKLKDPISKKAAGGLGFQYVDWSETKAYSLGLGMIFLNKAADGNGGGVAPEDERAVLQEISDAFVAAVDPETGASIGRETYIFDEIHSGPYVSDEADMMLGFDVGYRVSWSTSGGSLSVKKNDDGEYELGPTIVPNDKTWSGDHTSTALELVAGMFFCSEKIQIPEDGVNLLHIAPTALSIVGVPVPGDYDLAPLQMVSN